MHTGGFVGRVGGLAVALGVGSAVTLGWGCGAAVADAPDSSASSAAGSDANRGPAKQKPVKQRAVKTKVARNTAAGKQTVTKTEAEDLKAGSPEPKSPDRRAKFAAALSDAVRGALDASDLVHHDHDAEPPAVHLPVRDQANRTVPQPIKPDHESTGSLTHADVKAPEPRPSFDVERITDIPRSVLSTGVQAMPPVAPVLTAKAPAYERPVDHAPAAEDVGQTVVRTVSTLVGTVLNPFSVNAVPDLPADPPAAWAMLAFARREFEHTFRQPQNLLSSVVVSSQAETPVALAPGIVVPPELTDHVIVTGPPSLTDQLTVFALEAIKEVSKVIGVNITMKLGELITTPTPPWFTTIGTTVTKDTYEGGDVWIITPPNPTGERVIAVHGSGFVFNPNIIHWMDYAQMARQTGATVIVPRYPLIPNGGNAENSVPAMADFIANEVETYGAENVSVYADSAGGTLSALAVGKIVRDCAGDSACLESRVPSRMVLISPGLSGPEIYTDPNVALVNDPVVWLTEADKEYYGTWATGPEELWNPMLGPTAGMPPTTIYVGSREQAAPGALLYAKRMVDADPNADITVVIGMGQIHDWAQGGPIPINSQTANYRDGVYRQLGIVNQGAVAL